MTKCRVIELKVNTYKLAMHLNASLKNASSYF